ncbi:MAG TPA: two-component sensor histidine kinase [Candidatus Corynebacterium avicola]|uniref:histidine kinase n=1 Tax=Candidatus Corynebacterium avicola TaxID=2838527 RepID=A0A9D1RMT7_9CORY|nr:two-component sensor histidine kinase [Candidatus Corynebacterium avicola]
MSTSVPSAPTRYWPSGFSAAPWRFLTRAPVWKATVWTLLLAALFIPCLVVAIVLLPWLPLSARVADLFGRAGARWMAVAVPARRAGRWFDWRQAMELVAQLALGFAAFILACSAGVLTVVTVVIPFTYQSSQDGNLDLVFWSTTWPPAVFAVCLSFAVISALLFLYLSWVITGCSVAATVASNQNSEAEVAELTRSRAVLADAFTGERLRIERELHDGAQQYLTALQLNVAALELTAHNGGDLTVPMAEVKTNARQSLDSLRTTVRGIYPQVLKDKGLVEAVRELVAHSGINGEVAVTGVPRDLTDTPALLLYHCAAEGLTNAVKHGDAANILVTIDYRQDATVVTVDDDGRGVSTGPAGSSGSKGTGIAGLRERAATLGGTVSLTPATSPWTTRLALSVERNRP